MMIVAVKNTPPCLLISLSHSYIGAGAASMQAWLFTAKRSPEVGITGGCVGAVLGGMLFAEDHPPKEAFILMPLGMSLGGMVGEIGRAHV